MLQNTRYLGDEFYQAIIDSNTFEATQIKRIKRAEKLGRIREPKEEKEAIYPNVFRTNAGTQEFDNPFQQAEYAYSLIEMEVKINGSQ